MFCRMEGDNVIELGSLHRIIISTRKYIVYIFTGVRTQSCVGRESKLQLKKAVACSCGLGKINHYF